MRIYYFRTTTIHSKSSENILMRLTNDHKSSVQGQNHPKKLTYNLEHEINDSTTFKKLKGATCLKKASPDSLSHIVATSCHRRHMPRKEERLHLLKLGLDLICLVDDWFGRNCSLQVPSLQKSTRFGRCSIDFRSVKAHR